MRRPGQLVANRYEILRPLGLGGMGSLYVALDRAFDREIALKFLRQELASRDSARERLAREARLAVRLNSPHVVKVYDFGIAEDDCPFLTMELLRGKDLRQVLADGPLAVSRAVGIARQVALGLSDIHAYQVVHRDLKPSNIHVCENEDGTETVKILDFGIAKSLTSHSRNTESHGLLGTLAYMPPEQIRNPMAVGPAADLYGLAVVLYECLAGAPAFSAERPETLMFQVLQNAPEPLDLIRPHLPPDLVQWIARGMQKGPGARFPSAEAAIHALDAAMATRATAAVRLIATPDAVTSGAASQRSPLPQPRWRKAFPFAAAGMFLLVYSAILGVPRLKPNSKPVDAAVRMVGPAAVRPPEIPDPGHARRSDVQAHMESVRFPVAHAPADSAPSVPTPEIMTAARAARLPRSKSALANAKSTVSPRSERAPPSPTPISSVAEQPNAASAGEPSRNDANHLRRAAEDILF